MHDGLRNKAHNHSRAPVLMPHPASEIAQARLGYHPCRMEHWESSEVVYRGKLVNLRTGQVRLDDGSTAFREVVEHAGGVGVVPCLGDSVALIRQYRIAIDRDLFEIPAGKLEAGDTPEVRAAAELVEETGYTAGRFVPIGGIYPSCGFLTEKIYLFLAFDLTAGAQRLEADERIEVVHLPLENVRRMLRAHEFEDAKTVAGLYALFDYLAQDGN